jgi:hypothetical protein
METPKNLLRALDMVTTTAEPSPQLLGAARAAHAQRMRTIFDDPNVIGVGISEKIAERRPTGELSLCFYVEKKVSKRRLTAAKLIPPVVAVPDGQAVFTDVKQIGKLCRRQTSASRRSRAAIASATAALQQARSERSSRRAESISFLATPMCWRSAAKARPGTRSPTPVPVTGAHSQMTKSPHFRISCRSSLAGHLSTKLMQHSQRSLRSVLRISTSPS